MLKALRSRAVANAQTSTLPAAVGATMLRIQGKRVPQQQLGAQAGTLVGTLPAVHASAAGNAVLPVLQTPFSRLRCDPGPRSFTQTLGMTDPTSYVAANVPTQGKVKKRGKRVCGVCGHYVTKENGLQKLHTWATGQRGKRMCNVPTEHRIVNEKRKQHRKVGGTHACSDCTLDAEHFFY